jgi:hypothetical protein
VSGSGHLISLGRDNILGLGDKSLLSPNLIDHLQKKKIIVLEQAKDHNTSHDFIGNWIGSVDLELNGLLANEWDLFHKTLIGAGATTRDSPDQLLWT